jgi:methionine synthase II (cobalamin-independent)
MALFCRGLVFHDHRTYVMALADALSQEYQQIAKQGLLLQVRCVR